MDFIRFSGVFPVYKCSFSCINLEICRYWNTFATPKSDTNSLIIIIRVMKKGIHPENYRLVAFKDMSNDEVFITRSCANTRETLEVNGVEYPVVKVEISNTSHPFYTGKMKLVDTAGRVDKFYQRYSNKKK